MYRFSSDYRLKTKHDFQAVFAKPEKLSYRYWMILVTPNELKHARLGVIINKQRVRLSVARHAMKRIVRESFRLSDICKKELDIIVLLSSKWGSSEQSLTKTHWRDDIDHLWRLLSDKHP